MGEIIRAVFSLDGISRAPGQSGKLKRWVGKKSKFLFIIYWIHSRFKDETRCDISYGYLRNAQVITPWPNFMSIQVWMNSFSSSIVTKRYFLVQCTSESKMRCSISIPSIVLFIPPNFLVILSPMHYAHGHWHGAVWFYAISYVVFCIIFDFYTLRNLSKDSIFSMTSKSLHESRFSVTNVWVFRVDWNAVEGGTWRLHFWTGYY